MTIGDRDSLKYVLREGVPDLHRARVWAALCGSSKVLLENPHFYQHAVERLISSDEMSEFLKANIDMADVNVLKVCARVNRARCCALKL